MRRVGRSVLDAEASACIDAILARGRMGGSVSEARSVILHFRHGSSPAVATIEPAPPPAAEPTPPPTTGLPPTVDAALRAAVAGRAPAILACVEDVALAMQISWTRDGRLDALLRGDRQGSPEEACVRAIVQGITVPAPGSPGIIVHAVQR